MPICLEGGLSAKVADLKKLVIHTATKAATAAERSIILTHNGKLLHNERAQLREQRIKAYDTIQAQIPLPGGSQEEPDYELEALKDKPEEYAALLAARERARQ